MKTWLRIGARTGLYQRMLRFNLYCLPAMFSILHKENIIPEVKTDTWIIEFADQLTWDGVRKFGSSRPIRSSYVWFFVVPIAVRVMGPIEKAVAAVTKTDFHLTLPFSWKLMYVMTIFFILAQLIYDFRCPRIVRDYKNYGEYRSRHAGLHPMTTLIAETLKRAATDEIDACDVAFGERAPKVNTNAISPEDARITKAYVLENFLSNQAYYALQNSDTRFGEFFEEFRESCLRFRPTSLTACTLLYYLGTALFVYVGLQTFCRTMMWVLRS